LNQSEDKIKNLNYSIQKIFEKISFNYNYHLVIQSDPIKLGLKNTKLAGFSVCPSTQRNIAVYVNDGRLLKFELIKKHKIVNKNSYKNKIEHEHFLMDIFDEYESNNQIKLILNNCNIYHSDLMTNTVKICNSLSEDNKEPWLAIGSNSGLIIYDPKENLVIKKISIFNNSTINGIEWISCSGLILWSSQINEIGNYPTSGDTNVQSTKNELILIDIRTGINIYL
jgi:hypothetical protein